MAKREEDIIQYMLRQEWAVDRKLSRRRYLLRLARESKADPDIAGKIGGMLIWNQVIEQMLKDIVDTSIHFIKARIWPVAVDMKLDLDSATFGKVIDYFKQYATVQEDREEILARLKKFNIKRNQVVHDLFDIGDLKRLGAELDEYAALAEETMAMLEKYDERVCDDLRELERRV
ncbi:MAG: hypothetical protein IJA71_10955, partial [Clostridia bacterium]|nr:hypothetical protein [Clostridia bacterium]